MSTNDQPVFSQPKIFDDFKRVTELLPTPVYWLDINAILRGGNQQFYSLLGINDKYIGATGYDVYPYEIARHIVEHDKKIMRTGIADSQEEPTADILTGKTRYFNAFKSPVRDQNGKVIGLVGSLIEITDTKEKERILAIENQMQIAALEEQEKFRKISAQVAHDISSPLAALKMVVPHCDSLPENTRNVLNKSAIRIADIAENFLSQFKPKNDENNPNTLREATLISAELAEVLAEKKYEYSRLSIDFIANITQTGALAFINVDQHAFKRMLSNLINNAVDAFDGGTGEVMVSLNNIGNQVQIIVADNGKGMPETVKEKILNNIEVTSGKTSGHGIGFVQIRDTLINNDGKLSIEAQTGTGTKIILTFPKIATPEWMAERIELYNDDLVIILDDDDSIHDAWETRFENSAPGIKRQHFKQGNDAINFINTFSPEDKENIFLLTDYELLRQNLHGLDVIEQTKINRSILVTSHHGNLSIRDNARQANTKILPKPLAPVISITISEAEPQIHTKQQLKNIDIVLLDDDKMVTDTILNFVVKDHSLIDIYHKPQDLLNNLSQYNKNTIFLIDNQYCNENISGIEISEKLYFLGYTNLYLFTGEYFADQIMIPSYLRIINKNDFQAITELLS